MIEKNEKLGKKLYITGKGRCNLTNDCDPSSVLKNVVHGEKYLRSAIYGFSPADVMAFFEELGLDLKTERGNRVFPVTDKSSDVIRALERELKRSRVDVRLNAEIKTISQKDGKFVLSTADEDFAFEQVIVATGGMSYPSTGSTGDGYKFAKAFGHKVVTPKPALVALVTRESVSSLEGLSLKNVSLAAYDKEGKLVAEEFGEALFTKTGLSGPIALTISSYIAGLDDCTLILDLKPALDLKTLDARILRDFEDRKNQDIKNVLRALLPERLNGYVLDRAGIDPSKKVNSLLRDERTAIINTVKALSFHVKSSAPFSEAVITSGGVSVKDLKPSGESRLVDGLYFAGETVDVDALTGGFNLQIAWASGVAAARSILKNIQSAER